MRIVVARPKARLTGRKSPVLRIRGSAAPPCDQAEERVKWASRLLQPWPTTRPSRWTKPDGVAWVSLNRPAVRNAINQQMQTELHEVWHGFRYDDDVRCVVLASEGEAFCTGIDRAEAVTDDNNAAMAAGNYPGVPDAVDVRRSRS